MILIFKDSSIQPIKLIIIITVLLITLAGCDRFLAPGMYTLDLEISGPGEILINGDVISDNTRLTKELYSRVKLKARPQKDYTFSHWEVNGHQETEEELELYIERDLQVRAVFAHPDQAEIRVNLEINHNFPGSVVDDFYTLPHSSYPLSGTEKETSVSQMKKIREQKPKEIIVAPAEDSPAGTAVSLSEDGYRLQETRKDSGIALVRVPEGRDLDEFTQELEDRIDIRYAEPNHRYYTQLTNHPDDKHYNLQWHYPQIRLSQAWTVGTGSKEVRIAVLDTGVNTDHPDLGEMVDHSAGYNFIDDNRDFKDVDGHGTHIAGTIAADTNNNLGVAGIMWESSLIPVKVLENNSGTWADIASGIRYAAGLLEEPEIDEPAAVINLSLGGVSESETVREAVKEAREAGVLLVAAAGNFGQEGLLYPAAFPQVIGVGALDYNYPEEPNLAPYSNYGPDLDFLAPGGDNEVDTDDSGWKDGVWSTYADETSFGYEHLAGTSMAAAHVSGVVGLMLAEGINTEEISPVLNRTSMSLQGVTEDIGAAGLINAYWALNRVSEIKVVLYKSENGNLEPVRVQELSLPEREMTFSGLPRGDYEIRARIDVQETGRVDPGDYKGSSGIITIKPEQTAEINLPLKETAGE